ncbi:hypothetical protein CFC21_090920 [Triticum aestivum]|uniref:BTB domain-containing protein n=2 Tax=Triticum aestivum TaxID=4565 RepID=A0A9R1LF63_WHEAT|nr:hypothetical protein CFC21_090920 [Triticum aestivum]
MSSSGGFMAFEINSSLHNYLAVGQGAVYSEVVSAGGHCWRLACYPHGDPSHVPAPFRFISVYLELVGKPPSHADAYPFMVTFTAFAAHGDGAPPSHHAECGHVYTRGNHGLKRPCGFPEFIGDYTDIPIERGLTVMWRVRVTREKPGGPEIGHQLGRLLDPGLATWTDVSFVVAGETFRAHRALLAARSPVFEAQLFGAMLESSSASITLEDIEPGTFETMLRFIYTDALPDDPPDLEALRRLLVAADRFALDGLKRECAERLLGSMSTDTVVDMLRWACTYNCAELREECVDFVAARRNFNEVVLTVGFMELVLESPSILDDVKESAARQQRAKESLGDSDLPIRRGMASPYYGYYYYQPAAA